MAAPQGKVNGACVSWVDAANIKSGETGKQSSVKADNNEQYIIWDGELAADMTASGAGGIMTGQSETADTWYQVVVIGDSSETNSPNLLLVPEGITPAQTGYDLFRRIWWVRNDSSNDLWEFTQTGTGNRRRCWWRIANNNLKALDDGDADSYTDVDLSTWMPPTSRSFLELISFKSGTAGAASDHVDQRIKGSTLMEIPFGIGVQGDVKCNVPMEMATDENQLIRYRVTTTGVNGNRVDLFVLAWDDQL